MLMMDETNDILDAVATNVREITRLMTNDASNKVICLQKIDRCLSNLTSITAALEIDRITAMVDSLFALRNEVMSEAVSATIDTTAPSSSQSYCAERPLSG